MSCINTICNLRKYFDWAIQTTLVHKQNKISNTVILYSNPNTHQDYLRKTLKLVIILFLTELQYAIT